MKKLKFHLKRGFNLILALLFTAAIFTLLMFLIYRPTYKISFKGKFIGYSRDVFNIKSKVHESIFNGDDSVAYYEIDDKPEYEFTFMKAQFVPDDQKIIDEIKAEAKPVYKAYAVKEKDKVKARVSTYKEATAILAELKKKDSNNLDDITIELKYEDTKPKTTETKKVVADLYEEKPVYVAPVYREYAMVSSRSSVITRKVPLPVALNSPLSGSLNTRFGDGPAQGYWYSLFHKGIDIGRAYGVPIRAAAGGTVIAAGWGNGYGNFVEINHGNGVITLYAHASKLDVAKGDQVSAGQVIARVGSTGLSEANHLHFELIYNGSPLNPLHYFSP